jgi:hypothetical protein
VSVLLDAERLAALGSIEYLPGMGGKKKPSAMGTAEGVF